MCTPAARPPGPPPVRLPAARCPSTPWSSRAGGPVPWRQVLCAAMQTDGLHLVTMGDIPRASTTLAEAFHDDPIKCFLTGLDEVPVSTSLPFFRAFLKMQIPHGLTFATPDFESVSVWAPPGHWKVPVSQVARNMPTFLKLYKRRIIQNLQVLGDIERKHPKEPHFYLEFVGTAPAAQGKGMGTKVI